MKKEKNTSTGSSYWQAIARLFTHAGAFGTINLFFNQPPDEELPGSIVDNENEGATDDFFLQGIRPKGFDKEQDYYLFAQS